MKIKTPNFSKIMFVLGWAAAAIVAAFTMFMVWETKDLSPLTELLTGVFGLLSIIAGFYYNKAKKENEIKLRKRYGEDVYNDTKGEGNL